MCDEHIHDSFEEHDHAYLHEHGIEHSHSHEHGHGHTHENTKSVLNRLSRAIGHLQSVKRMVEEGHIVGNHTLTHPDMSAISTKESFAEELSGLEQKYVEATGKKMKKFYRPPQGRYSESNLKMAKEMGYTTIFWSLAYVDWYESDQPTEEEAMSKLIPRTHPGAIVLLHSTSSTNAAILDDLLTKWEDMGYRFAPLTELSAPAKS